MIKYTLAMFALLVGTMPVAQAQHVPDVMEFRGNDGLGFPTDESLTLGDGGTIEFWVGVDWAQDPGYDPVVLSNAGPDGALYTIAILGDRLGLSLQSGAFLGDVAFDFRDGRMHHVALVDFSDAIAAMVDGQVVGWFDTTLPALRSAGFWVGTADGVNAPFVGAVAGLRIWSVALERATLVEYATRDIDDPQRPHPDLDQLIAKSDFHNAALALTALDVEIDDSIVNDDGPSTSDGEAAP